ncbi:MAG TPA: DUF1631 domain-containing protein [Rhodanobacteraceae bacterium]|nr:DUF1631 domain-containing protein [Rhodanobacteraceae bacterium]
MTPIPTDPPADQQRNATTKVVEIGSRATDADHDHVGGLLAAVRDMTVKEAANLVAGLLDNVDDTLFDLAEKAESNASQTEYFDGMRETRKRRPRIERLFSERVTRGFTDFAAGRAARPGSEAQKAFSASGELSLVDDRELEESLAVSSMVAKADGRLSSALVALNQRLSVLSGGRTTTNANNPLGPNALTEAFRVALGELTDINIRVRLIILKMFERYVLNALDALYHDVNMRLVQAGILPQLRRPAVVRGHGYTGGTTRAQTTAPDEAVEAADDGEYDTADQLHSELMQRLTSLLAARRHGSAGMGGGRMSAGAGAGIASLSPAELLSALTLLQGETRPLPSQPIATDTNSAAEVVQHLKDALMAQIQRLSGEAKARISGSDEDTIDLVGMLFEYILQDHTIPAPMQVLLSRLQIPYLKVAILDRRMFAHASHPARKLLDQLADAAKGWSEESDRDHRLFGKVKAVVETLLQDFDDDIGVFERQLADFTQFAEQNRKRAELAESRATEAARGRERLQDARRRAAQEILSRISGRNLPTLLRGVLTRPWANYLVLIVLRQGVESQEFRSAVRFIDDFVASADAPQGEAAHAEYKNALPSIEKHLRTGLATVAFQEPDIERLLDELRKFWRQQLGEPAPVAPADAPAVDAAVLGMNQDAQPAITDAAAEAEEDFESDDMSVDIDAGSLQAIRELKVGGWVEFIDEQGTRERAKLSWISPISGKYLFVNRRGLKVADRTAVQLANELQGQRLMILEEVPLFDRALDAIVDRLRNAHAEQPPQQLQQQPQQPEG